MQKDYLDFKEVLLPDLTQAEGFILGVGAKMFTIAGPVILYGVSASVVYGLIYWIIPYSKTKGLTNSVKPFYIS